LIQFDWTINVSVILSTLTLLGSVGFAWYRVVTNHIAHFREEITARFDRVDIDIRELRGFVFPPRST